MVDGLAVDRLALSALDWWGEAGVDVIVDDLPRDWLARAAPAAAVSAPPVIPAAALPADLAADLAAFRAFLLSDASVPGPAGGRIDAMGDPACGTMIVIDMPEPGDRAAGALLSGEIGILFDRMLAAIGLGRAAIYLAACAPARTIGRIGPADAERLGVLMRHHIGLVAPRRLLVMGDLPVRALSGLTMADARAQVTRIDHPGGSVAAVASFHPRLLAQKADYKAAAWADLKRFMAL